MHTSFNKLSLKKYLFLFAFGLSSHILLAGGLSAWDEKTPNGNRLYYDGTHPVRIEFYYSEYQPDIEHSISFNKFFFDKNYVVASADSIYYIIDEVHPSITKISDSIELKRSMDKLGIKEHTWKNQNYGTDSFALFFLLILGILGVVVTVVIYALLLVIRYFLKLKNEGVMKKRYLFLFSIGVSFLLILDLFIF